MSRTVRRKRKGRGLVRDGADQYPSRSCRHHGDCDYCRSNRTHANRRREPLDDDELQISR